MTFAACAFSIKKRFVSFASQGASETAVRRIAVVRLNHCLRLVTVPFWKYVGADLLTIKGLLVTPAKQGCLQLDTPFQVSLRIVTPLIRQSALTIIYNMCLDAFTPQAYAGAIKNSKLKQLVQCA